MDIFTRLKDAFFIDSEKYKIIESGFVEENAKSVKVFSFISMMIYFGMFVASFFNTLIAPIKPLYLILALICLAIDCIYIFKKEISSRFVLGSVYFYQTLMLTFGIVLATVILKDEMTISFVVLMVILPILFLGRAATFNTITVISIVIYILIAHNTQRDIIFNNNMVNIIPYGIASCLLTAFIMKIKMQKYLYMSENQLLLVSGKRQEDKIHIYESFINEMMRTASSGEDPEIIIQRIMQYIGINLSSDRAYIFEDKHDGTYANTYEWCREGIAPEIEKLQNLRYDNFLDVWIAQFRQGNNVIIKDLEEYRSVSSEFYNLMKSENIKTLVSGPIKREGKIIGFYGLDNPPEEHLEEVSDLMYLMQFLVELMLRLRDNARALEDMAKTDQLTGCMNRSALNWAYDREYDQNASFAVIGCDLNGLKAVNDAQGHEAGDRFICRTADVLKEIYGDTTVYRIGGDEFVVVLQGMSKEEMDSKLQLVRLQIGTTASIGVVYEDKPKLAFSELMRIADSRMYEEKVAYYKDRDRRKI